MCTSLRPLEVGAVWLVLEREGVRVFLFCKFYKYFAGVF